MKAEKRVEVYLPLRDYRAVRERAKHADISISELVRDALAEYIAKTPADAAREGYARLRTIVGLAQDGSGAAERHDKFLGERRW